MKIISRTGQNFYICGFVPFFVVEKTEFFLILYSYYHEGEKMMEKNVNASEAVELHSVT